MKITLTRVLFTTLHVTANFFFYTKSHSFPAMTLTLEDQWSRDGKTVLVSPHSRHFTLVAIFYPDQFLIDKVKELLARAT